MGTLVYEDDLQSWQRLPFPERMRARLPRVLAWSIQTTPLIIVIFTLGFVLANTIRQGTLFPGIFGATAFIMLFSEMAALPTKYQIFSDRIRMVCGYVFRFDIPFSNIEDATAAT